MASPKVDLKFSFSETVKERLVRTAKISVSHIVVRLNSTMSSKTSLKFNGLNFFRGKDTSSELSFSIRK